MVYSYSDFLRECLLSFIRLSSEVAGTLGLQSRAQEALSALRTAGHCPCKEAVWNRYGESVLCAVEEMKDLFGNNYLAVVKPLVYAYTVACADPCVCAPAHTSIAA